MSDLFDKISKDATMRLVKMGKQQGIYPYFKPLSETEGTSVIVDGRKLIMIGSNNYLGLTTHPKVRQAAKDAIDRFGTSCTGSRFLNGTLELHKELERRLAIFLGTEAAVVFGTGYTANLGAITALMGRDDIAICDKEVHACIIDAVQMAGCKLKRFKHNDLADLERILQELDVESPNAGRMVLVDGVYSMGGDLCPIPEMSALCKKYNTRFFVDDAHGLGVMGPGGRGTHFHFNSPNAPDLIMGTFSKAFASLGGVIAGSADVIEYVQHKARSLIFSASMPPSAVAAVLACMDIIEADPDYTKRVHVVADAIRTGLKDMGFDIGHSVTPIVPVMIGSEMNTVFAWKAFYDYGVYVNPVLPPAVPPNKGLLRTSYMATHTDQQVEEILSAFHEVGIKAGLISG